MIIGVIDSGRGGLVVAEKIKRKEDQLLILLDQGFFPYGTKSKEFLLKRSYYLAHLLIAMKAELILLACNTLSIYVLSFLKYSLRVPVIGIFDYFKPYLTREYTLLGSKATITYAKKNSFVQVYDGSKFIDAIEKKKEITSYLKELAEIKSKALLLGCTHFLAVEENKFPLPVITQIPMLLEDIKKIRKKNDS